LVGFVVRAVVGDVPDDLVRIVTASESPFRIPDRKIFLQCGAKLQTIRQSAIPREIDAYRNEGHNIPAIIGQQWNADGNFVHHFLPRSRGTKPRNRLT